MRSWRWRRKRRRKRKRRSRRRRSSRRSSLSYGKLNAKASPIVLPPPPRLDGTVTVIKGHFYMTLLKNAVWYRLRHGGCEVASSGSPYCLLAGLVSVTHPHAPPLCKLRSEYRRARDCVCGFLICLLRRAQGSAVLYR